MLGKCPACSRKARRSKRVDVSIFGVDLGAFDTEVCDECGEALFTSQSVDMVESRAKELGLWGLASKVKVAKSGNSLVVRIPPPLARYLNIRIGQEVLVAPDKKHALILELA